jgi:hypothetical protein
MSGPVPIRTLLSADEGALAGIIEQVGRLYLRVVLFRAAVRRLPTDHELTESRLEQLARSLQHAADDAKAAHRSLSSGR